MQGRVEGLSRELKLCLKCILLEVLREYNGAHSGDTALCVENFFQMGSLDMLWQWELGNPLWIGQWRSQKLGWENSYSSPNISLIFTKDSCLWRSLWMQSLRLVFKVRPCSKNTLWGTRRQLLGHKAEITAEESIFPLPSSLCTSGHKDLGLSVLPSHTHDSVCGSVGATVKVTQEKT